METKQTKGEWYVSDIPQEDGKYIYTKENPFSAIARVYKGENPHSTNAEANAKLIAHSPLLLQDLNDLVWLIEQGATIEEIQERAKTAKQTIKKATE
jgi:hypothetical protein